MSTPQGPETSKLMSFREHLKELRGRLVRATAVVVLGCFFTWEYRVELFDFLSRPIADALANNGIYSFQAITLTESISVYMKTTFVGALVLLSPYLFWELWAFIAPGLYSKERRFILPLTGFSVAFFLLGAVFAYAVLLPYLTDWLVTLTLDSGHTSVMVTLQNTYSFAFTFLLMFGLVFELPLVLFFLALWGSVTGKGLLKFWRYFVVVSFIVAGVLTPPEPLSQVFMAVPLNVLYGFGVIVAYTVTRARKSGRADASRMALRAMALSMLTLLVLGGGLVLYLSGLLQRPLTAWAPDDATFVAGLNPRVLGKEKAVLGLLRGVPAASAALEQITQRVPLDEITDGLVLGANDGRRAVLLRAPGLGESVPGVTNQSRIDPDPNRDAASLPPSLVRRTTSAPPCSLVRSLPGECLPVHATLVSLDGDTIALGPADLVAALAAREPATLELSAEGKRLLARLAASGPFWVWLPPTSPLREALLGRDNARELASVGAALALGERRQVVFDLPLDLLGDGSSEHPLTEEDAAHAGRTSRADRVLARIEAARVAALAYRASDRTEALEAAIDELATELEALASPAAKTRLQALRASLTRLGRDAAPTTFPALSALAPHLQGVSVRREDNRLTLTAELDDAGLSALFQLIAGL